MACKVAVRITVQSQLVRTAEHRRIAIGGREAQEQALTWFQRNARHGRRLCDVAHQKPSRSIVVSSSNSGNNWPLSCVATIQSPAPSRVCMEPWRYFVAVTG